MLDTVSMLNLITDRSRRSVGDFVRSSSALDSIKKNMGFGFLFDIDGEVNGFLTDKEGRCCLFLLSKVKV